MLGKRDGEGEVRPSLEEVQGYSFDDLAKGLASRTISRRQALWFVGAAGLGGLLSTAFSAVAEAKKKKK